MKKKYFYLIIAVISFSACEKEDNARKAFGGNYAFYHYEVDYFNADGKTIDSTYSSDLSGTINLINENTDASEWYNRCEYSLTDIPKGWFDNEVKSTTPYWHIDQGNMKLINFFVEPNPGRVFYASYTIESKKKDQYILTYVKLINSRLSYVERLYLKRTQK